MPTSVERRIVSLIDSQREGIVTSLQELVQIPSVTGAEKEAQDFMSRYFRKIGLHVDIFEANDELLTRNRAYRRGSLTRSYHDRPNIVGVLAGSGGGRSMILNGHIDVVSPGPLSEWRYGPWSGMIIGNRLYGRGSSDMKAGLIAMATAAGAVKEAVGQLKGDVILQSVIEEETVEGELGRVGGTFACIAKGYVGDGAIIPEPTAGQVHNSMDGLIRFRLSVRGKAGHWRLLRGNPARGVSAVEKMTEIISTMHGARWLRERAFNIGVLCCGQWVFTIPVDGLCEGAIGVFPREDVREVRKRLCQFVRSFINSDDWLARCPPKFEVLGALPSAATDASHPLINAVKNCHRIVTGRSPRTSPARYGTDMYLLSRYGGMPTIMYGPGSVSHAHAKNEYVELDSLVTCTKVIALTLLRWCGLAE